MGRKKAGSKPLLGSGNQPRGYGEQQRDEEGMADSVEERRMNTPLSFGTKFAFGMGALVVKKPGVGAVVSGRVAKLRVMAELASLYSIIQSCDRKCPPANIKTIQPSGASLILLLGRIWDAVSDPTVGYLITKTKTRYGSLRPWIAWSTPLIAGAYTAIWCVPDVNQNGKFVYVLFMYLIYQSTVCAYHVPYSALTVHLSNIPSERDSATLYRIVFETVGTLVGATLQGQLTAAMFGPIGGGCNNGTINNTFAEPAYGPLSDETFPNSTRKHQSEVQWQIQKTFMVGGGTVGVMCLLCGLIVVWNTKEQKSAQDQQKLLGGLKFGKKPIFITGLVMLLPLMLITFWLPNNMDVRYMYALMSGIGAAIGAVYLIPPAMLPDVIDEATLRDGGVRREAMFYAYFVFCQKFGTGFAVSLSTLALQAFGNYKSGYCAARQDPMVQTTLRTVQGPITAGMIGISLIFAFFYPLTTDKVVNNVTREALVHVPASIAAAASRGGEFPLVMNWHGMMEQPTEQQGLSDMDRVADEHGFVVVYPKGGQAAEVLGHKLPGYTHNGGGCCSSACTDGAGRLDDVAFARALVTVMPVAINRSRVYSTGFSNGGFMSYRLGCEAPDLVAAIAPVSAVLANKPNLVMQSTQKFECNRSSSSTGTGTGGNGRLVPVLHIHGTQDQLVTYAGNPLFEWPSVVSTVLNWVGGGANGGHNNSSSSSSSIMPVTTFENKSTVTNNSVLCQNYGEDFNYD
eukprot:gene11641-12322_t